MNKQQQKVFDTFCHRYNARVRNSREQVYQRIPVSYVDWSNDPQVPFHQDVKTVPAIDITMAEEDFKKLLDIFEEIHDPYSNWSQFEYMSKHLGPGWIDNLLKLKSQHEQDDQVRRLNPAVQKAYDNYMMLLRITGD